MTQMALPWWPRTTSSDTTTTTTDKSTKAGKKGNHHHHLHRSCCFSKFMRKLRKQSRTMLQCRSSIGVACGGRKVECRGGYDPLSYSLNFDDTTRGCGGGDKSLLDEEDYYRFCAFTSRFVINSTAPAGGVVPSRLVLATATH